MCLGSGGQEGRIGIVEIDMGCIGNLDRLFHAAPEMSRQMRVGELAGSCLNCDFCD